MSGRPPSTTIFVGNLPFDATEQQLQEILSTAGPIKNFRLVNDRESGRPKGFGFCEYYDVATAESAHRNLNGYELGGRTIRIDFAEDFQTKGRGGGFAGGGGGGGDGGRPPPGPQGVPMGMQAAAMSAQQVRALLNGSASSDPEVQEQLNAAFASMSRVQLYDIMREMKGLIAQDRGGAIQYFAERPGLTKALFQGQILLGMVKAPSVPPPQEPAYAPPSYPAQGPAQPPPPPPAPVPVAVAIPAPYPDGGQLGVPGPGMPMAAAGGPLGLQHPGGGLMGPAGQPMQVVQLQGGQPVPVAAAGMMAPQQVVSLAPPQQPMVVQQQPPPPAPADPAAAQTAALLRQVASMTDEQINQLQPEHKAQVLYVKEQIRLGVVSVPGL